jgi:hypothetical protein
MTRVRGYDSGVNVLEQGRTLTVISETVYGSGVTQKTFATISDGAVLSLFVSAITGSLSIRVLTETADGKSYELFTFPEITAPTSGLTLKTAAPTMGNIRVEATYNGSVSYEVHARGVASGEVSAKVVSPSRADVGKVLVSTVPTLIVPSSNSNRSAILLRNLDENGTLYIGFTENQASEATGWPVLPGESFMLNISGGQAVYGIGTVSPMDVRYVEAVNS